MLHTHTHTVCKITDEEMQRTKAHVETYSYSKQKNRKKRDEHDEFMCARQQRKYKVRFHSADGIYLIPKHTHDMRPPLCIKCMPKLSILAHSCCYPRDFAIFYL